MKTSTTFNHKNLGQLLKKLTFGCLFLLAGLFVKAQGNEKFDQAMQKGLSLLDSAKTSADCIAAANHFERVAGVDQKNWLPVYYAALSKMYAGVNDKESADKKDAYYDAAKLQIEKAIALEPQNSEVWALSGYIKFMQLYVDPMSRMQTGMNAAMADIKKAQAIDPQNPRPDFVLAQNTFFTPEAYGGGKKMAKPLFEDAAKKFETQKKGNFIPTWGQERNLMLLKQCD